MSISPHEWQSGSHTARTDLALGAVPGLGDVEWPGAQRRTHAAVLRARHVAGPRQVEWIRGSVPLWRRRCQCCRQVWMCSFATWAWIEQRAESREVPGPGTPAPGMSSVSGRAAGRREVALTRWLEAAGPTMVVVRIGWLRLLWGRLSIGRCARDVVVSEGLRFAHRDSPEHVCTGCSLAWPCESRLRLDESSVAARRTYAAQVHADWLAGTRSPTRCRLDGEAR